MDFNYDIIVIGAGHAGSEAAAAAANLGSNVLLITMDMEKIAQMSCNPAMGGIAKGQIVREIDALGGYAGIVSDKTAIQFRMLNRSKGPAMWSPRVQSDRNLFSKQWRKTLENINKLYFWQDTVNQLLVKNKQVYGIKTAYGFEFFAKKIILTAGTFLNGIMHVGGATQKGGRAGDSAVKNVSNQLLSYGIKTQRMKTGTPVRIDGRTIDFSQMNEQMGDNTEDKFSFLPSIKRNLPQSSCFITYTNPDVHTELKKGFKFSPLFNGTIKGTGPRYCPSIEDKIYTFADKEMHQLFLEPEGVNSIEYYLNGFSSSLPLNIQVEAMKRIPGLQKARIFRPGYAIEYDYFDPTQLYHSMESKIIKNLYLAGQVNGTTGYEEAGAQGLIAGVNAHLSLHGSETFVLNRNEAYIGVLIDDLVTKGVDEPYRMFTSRAEFRILLRQDNADTRLTEKAFKLGLATNERYNIFLQKKKKVHELIDLLNKTSANPEDVNQVLLKNKTSILKQKQKYAQLLLRPQLNLSDLLKTNNKFNNLNFNYEIISSAEIQIKYKGYIERENIIVNKIKRLEYIKIPEGFKYKNLQAISTEARQKLTKIKPKTIAQASRIPGVSPSDINVLLVFLGR